MEAVPAPGEHTRAILGELGLSEDAVDALVAEGVA
jgi:crotonobetainyl-CoA:carnitine CoA-transferase CaiB-like acyl-CoA transferase